MGIGQVQAVTQGYRGVQLGKGMQGCGKRGVLGGVQGCGYRSVQVDRERILGYVSIYQSTFNS